MFMGDVIFFFVGKKSQSKQGHSYCGAEIIILCQFEITTIKYVR